MGVFEAPDGQLDGDRLAIRGSGTGDAQNFLISTVQNAKISLIGSTGRDIERDRREGLSFPYRDDHLVSAGCADQLHGGNRSRRFEDTI